MTVNPPTIAAAGAAGAATAGGDDMRALVRAFDWSRGPLGPQAHWPAALRIAAGICLESRFPSNIWWGPELVQIYNDGYREILGAKHPRSLGQRGYECWAEIWPVVGPLYEQVVTTGEAIWATDLRLDMNRYGFLEETYFTFSYSPIRDESGGIGGVLITCSETTDHVLGERRLRALRDLGAQSGRARSGEEACRLAADVLEQHPADVPFALLYLLDPDGAAARLQGAAGRAPGGPAAPAVIDPAATGAEWHGGPERALVLPLAAPGSDQAAGLLVAGLSPMLALDEGYRGFLDLVAAQAASAIANARAYEAERRRAEALDEVERAMGQLRFALEVTRTVTFEWDLVADTAEYSDTAPTVLGIPGGLIPARRDIVHPDDRQKFEDTLAKAFATRPGFDFEFRILRPDTGAVRWIHATGVIARNEEGNAMHAAGVLRDVTERRQAEEQAQVAQRMEAVGQLAGGVAHEVNNALTGVLGFAHLLAARMPESDPMREDIGHIIRSGERAAGVAQQLLAYSRCQLLQPKRLDLSALVQGFQPLLRQTVGPDRELALQVADALWVNADQAQLEQVLLNLALNARDAMRSGDRLTVGVRQVEVPGDLPRHPSDAVEIVPGAYALLTVADTGTGMDAGVKARLFEPFFTTKPVGQGTGLGLPTAYGIVRQSGGHIWIESEPGRGTTVSIVLPLVPAPGLAVPVVPEPVPGGRSETVLVVDDEPVVLMYLERLLREAGYTVNAAGSAQAALEQLGRPGAAPGLVVTDLVMPGMSGRELAERLAVERPGVPVLFMSGYTDDESVRRGLLPTGAAFIQKPLDVDRLLTMVRALLDRAGRTGTHAAAAP